MKSTPRCSGFALNRCRCSSECVLRKEPTANSAHPASSSASNGWDAGRAIKGKPSRYRPNAIGTDTDSSQGMRRFRKTNSVSRKRANTTRLKAKRTALRANSGSRPKLRRPTSQSPKSTCAEAAMSTSSTTTMTVFCGALLLFWP